MALSWLSILPEHLSTYETWAIRIFLFLGIMTIGPGLAIVVYDILLYFVRSAMYEIPVFGGRAQGKARPRAPSLSERPDGQSRRLSVALQRSDPSPSRMDGASDEATEAKPRRRVSFKEQ